MGKKPVYSNKTNSSRRSNKFRNSFSETNYHTGGTFSMSVMNFWERTASVTSLANKRGAFLWIWKGTKFSFWTNQRTQRHCIQKIRSLMDFRQRFCCARVRDRARSSSWWRPLPWRRERIQEPYGSRLLPRVASRVSWCWVSSAPEPKNWTQPEPKQE